jgi:hypothetical protein
MKPGELGGGRARLRGTIDVVTLQTLARRDDVAGLTGGYGLVVADECHHVPAAALTHRYPGGITTIYHDLLLSTLSAYLEAVGGHASVIVRFADGHEAELDLSQLT